MKRDRGRTLAKEPAEAMLSRKINFVSGFNGIGQGGQICAWLARTRGRTGEGANFMGNRKISTAWDAGLE